MRGEEGERDSERERERDIYIGEGRGGERGSWEREEKRRLKLNYNTYFICFQHK